MTSETYEFGKTGPGRPFHKLCVDLDRVWAMCRLSRYERRILQYVREHTWGVSAVTRSETTPCPIPSALLAQVWRVPRQRVGEAVNALVDDGLLVRIGANYLIGKNVFAWGADRIEPEDIEYCIIGATRCIANIEENRARDATESGTENRADSHRKTCGTEKRAARKSVPTRTEKRAEDDGSARNFVPPHIRNAPASEDFQKIEEDSQVGGLLILKAGGETAPAYGQDDWGCDDNEDLSGEIITPLDPIPALLVTDGSDESPSSLVGPAGDDDERLRDYCKALVLETTRDIDQAEAIWRRVGVWLGWKIKHRAIASFVFETCKIKYDTMTRKNIPPYVHAIMKSLMEDPNQKVPPAPPGWEPPPVPGPAIHRASDEFKARRRQYEAAAIAKRDREKAERAAEAAEAGERVAAMMGRGTLRAIGGGR